MTARQNLNPHGKWSGEKARRWRRGVGAMTQGKGGDRTVKFPLDIDDATEALDFDCAAQLYKIVEGVGEGSLLGFVCAAHLSGFRLFSTYKGEEKELPAAMKEAAKSGKAKPTIVFDANRDFIEIATNEERMPHKVVALAAREIRRENPEIKSVSGSRIQNKMLTGSATPHGLSWLFGAGWEKWLANENKTDQEIAKLLAVPREEMRRVKQLRRFARAIPKPPFYRAKNYANFRRVVSQKAASWISNYWKRLGDFAEVEEKPKKLPRRLLVSRAGEIFAGLPFAAQDIEKDARDLNDALSNFGGVVAKMRGEARGLPNDSDFAGFAGLKSNLSYFCGRLAQLRNLAAQRAANDDKFFDDLAKDIEKTIDGVEKLKKLNKISGGAIDAAARAEEIAAAFNALVKKRGECCVALFAGGGEGLFAAVRADERKRRDEAKKRGRAAESDDRELAARRLMREACDLARVLSAENRDIFLPRIRPLFADEKTKGGRARENSGAKNCNRHIVNRQGAVYASPWAERGRHNLFAVDIDAAARFDYVGELRKLAAAIELKLSGGRADDLRDWLDAQSLSIRLQTRLLPADIPAEKSAPLADPPPAIKERFALPPWLADELENGAKKRSVAVALNLYQSAIRGLAHQAMRDSFIARVVFNPIEQDKLLYAPKPADKKPAWNPPARYESPFAESLAAARANGDETSAAPEDAFARLIEARKVGGARSNAVLTAVDGRFLSQMPHDWLFPLDDWENNAPQARGIPIGKNAESLIVAKKDIAAGKENGQAALRARPALRLRGAAAMKTRLDEVLRGKTARGEHSLIIEQEYEQRREWRAGELRLIVKKTKLRADAAIPIDSPAADKLAENRLFHNIVAIDLGERGIAWAVFDLRKFLRGDLDWSKSAPECFGMFPIPSIRRLQAAIKRHRGSFQPRQKMQESYSRAIEKRRANVVGDVCHRIDVVCAEFRAFPILESDIAGFESGGNRLKVVYGSVLNRYRFSEIDAHKKQRAERWFADDGCKWTHPYLIRAKGKNAGNPLFLFPGAVVRAAGTSQICSKCGRNPLAALHRDAISESKQLSVEPGGIVNLPDDGKGNGGRIRLCKREIGGGYSASERNLAKRRKEVLSPNAPLDPGMRRAGELRGLVKFNQRRPQKDARSRDTKQSVYCCVYADCGARMHADENAAINIGRRFLGEIIDREKSRENLSARE